jgi:hypothetical protein
VVGVGDQAQPEKDVQVGNGRQRGRGGISHIGTRESEATALLYHRAPTPDVVSRRAAR